MNILIIMSQQDFYCFMNGQLTTVTNISFTLRSIIDDNHLVQIKMNIKVKEIIFLEKVAEITNDHN